jgi:V/A-type H+-transporting ATPase subunit K
MEVSTMKTLGEAGAIAILGLACVGASIGAGVAGSAVIGAWKKAFAQGKKAVFTMLVFAGCPLSQVIYSIILMLNMKGRVAENPENWAAYLSAGIFGGLAIGVCSWFQAVAASASADALGETGKGFANYLMVIGICETVSLFVLVFTIMALG